MKWAEISRRFAIALFAFAVLYPNSGSAEGALAIGQPPNIVKDGYAFGISWNYSTKEEANSNALERCRATKSEGSRKLCKVIRSFTHECAAVAMDPKDGTPGAGWAIEATQEKAEENALAECRATAGPGRGQFCVISSRKGSCDTN
jgi:hypothetical protein